MKCSVSLLALAVCRLPRRRLHHHRRRPAPRRRRPPAARRRAGRADRGRGRRLRRPGRARACRIRRDQAPRAMGERDLHHPGYRRARRLFRHDRHRDGRPLRQRGGALPERRPASAPTRGASSTCCAAASPCRRRPPTGAAAELNRISTDLSVAIWPRPRDDERRDADRQRDRGADGHGPQSRPAAGDVDELEQQCRRADARRNMRA